MTITCLLGDPIVQSVSPSMYNYFGERAGLDFYAHIKVRVPKEDEKDLPRALEAAKTLGFSGLNITIPYKLEVMKYLDRIDKRAAAIGAVNAVVSEQGKFVGYNTDGMGALLAIENRLRKIQSTDRVVVFGAGGAARAITDAVSKKTKHITLLNREEDFSLAQTMQKQFRELGLSLQVVPLREEHVIDTICQAQFVINATSVGMQSRESIVSKEQLKEINAKTPLKKKYFFDAVFNPYTTQFLRLAKGYGAPICQGLYMTIYQGAASFELWTGKKVANKDVETAHRIMKQKMGLKN
jgi:shikimate dehydrogenase